MQNTGSQWQVVQQQDGIEVSCRENKDGSLSVSFSGDFPENSWSCTPADSQMLNVSFTENKANKAGLTVTALGQCNTSAALLCTGKYAGRLRVMADENNALQLMECSLTPFEGQEYSGELSGYPYTLGCFGDHLALTVQGAGALDFDEQYVGDYFITSERVSVGSETGTAEAEVSSSETEPVWGPDEKDETSPKEEIQDEQGDALDAIYTITAAKRGSGTLRICCEDLTQALEITASADVSGCITVSDVKAVEHTYISSGTINSNMIGISLGDAFTPNISNMLGYERVSTQVEAVDADDKEENKANGNSDAGETSVTVDAVRVTIGCNDGSWIYEVADTDNEELAAKVHLGDNYSEKTASEGTTHYRILTGKDLSIAVWSKDGKVLMVYPEDGSPDNLQYVTGLVIRGLEK